MARKRKPVEFEQRRNEVSRQHEQRRDHNATVRRMLEQALAAPRQRPDMDELLARLDHVYELAIRLDPPVLGAAVQAVMASAKLQGLVIDKQVSMIGTPDDFSRVNDPEQIYAQMRERIGSEKTERFKLLVAQVLDQDHDDVIDGEVDDSEDGND